MKIDTVSGHVAIVRRFGCRVVAPARGQCVSADAQAQYGMCNSTHPPVDREV
jgi:hypothetical protein